jgi:hypothetical protein
MNALQSKLLNGRVMIQDLYSNTGGFQPGFKQYYEKLNKSLGEVSYIQLVKFQNWSQMVNKVSRRLIQ